MGLLSFSLPLVSSTQFFPSYWPSPVEDLLLSEEEEIRSIPTNEQPTSPLFPQFRSQMHDSMGFYRKPSRDGRMLWRWICDPHAKILPTILRTISENPILLSRLSQQQPDLYQIIRERRNVEELLQSPENVVNFVSQHLDLLVREEENALLSVDTNFDAMLGLYRETHCDLYGAGGGFCLMQSHGESGKDSRQLNQILLNSNCQIWRPPYLSTLDAGVAEPDTAAIRGGRHDETPNEAGILTQLFHCPLGLPIALFLLPKSGTSSAVNFLVQSEPMIRDSLATASDRMLVRPKVMIDWLSDELY